MAIPRTAGSSTISPSQMGLAECAKSRRSISEIGGSHSDLPDQQCLSTDSSETTIFGFLVKGVENGCISYSPDGC